MKAQAIRNNTFSAIKARALNFTSTVVAHEATSAIIFGLMMFGLVYCGVLFGVKPL